MLEYSIPRDVFDEIEAKLLNFRILVDFERKEAERLQRHAETPINLKTLQTHSIELYHLLQQAKLDSMKHKHRLTVTIPEKYLDVILEKAQQLGMDLFRAEDDNEVWELEPKVRHNILSVVHTVFNWKDGDFAAAAV